MSTIVCDDTCNVLNMQQITPQSNRGNSSDITSGGNEMIKEPTNMAVWGRHLRNEFPIPTCWASVHVMAWHQKDDKHFYTNDYPAQKTQYKPFSFLVAQTFFIRKMRKKRMPLIPELMYHQVSNIRHTLVGNKIVDQPDAVGASPVGAAPTTSSFST